MIRVGKIAAAHGLQGAVILTHIADKPGWLQPNMVLYLELQKGSRIPYFVQKVNDSRDGSYIIRLEDVNTIDDARKLIGKHVYVGQELLTQMVSDSPLLWIGFNIVDRRLGGLGPLEDVVNTGSQWLGQLTINGAEVLIPLVDEFIIELNQRNKFIRVDLPEGLLDVYAGKSIDHEVESEE
jgi:16S rRNA processing protein RimM